MFDADKPIQKSTEDRLNRTFFAEHLAQSILDQKEPESVVIGLFGESGSGKTSVLNLISEALRHAAENKFDEERSVIFHFNPWNYASQQQLIYSFFKRFTAELHKASFMKNQQRLIYLLEWYGSFFTKRPMAVYPSLWQKWFSKKNTNQYGWDLGRDLISIKDELNELLKQAQHKIIITIDNLSRISEEELKQVFQIIKCIGDFNHTIYLLTLDKEKIKDKKDIEKIVQLPFEIPLILESDLELLLADRMKPVILNVKKENWNKEQWREVYGVLKYFFSTCRDIARYVNALSLSYPRVKEIVNPVDYFALTALQVFLPEVYSEIRENKDLFTDLLAQVYNSDQINFEKDKARCEMILARNERLPKEVLIELLVVLFPRLNNFYFPEKSYYHSEELARKQKRVSCPDLFDIYFQLSLQPSDIPFAQIQALIATPFDQVAFSRLLTKFNQDNTVLKFLEKLDHAFLKKIHSANVSVVINGLLDNGDLFPTGIVGYLNLNTYARIHRIVRELLSSVEDREQRFLFLQDAIASSTKSIDIICYTLNEFSQEHAQNTDNFVPENFRSLAAEHLDSLKKLAASRIQYWAETDRLAEHPQLFSLLTHWNEWGETKAMKQFIATLVESDKGLIAFLGSALKEPIEEILIYYQKNPEWIIYLQAINNIIAVDDLVNHVVLLFEDPYFEKLREKEQLALMLFLDLMNVKAIKYIPKTVV